MNKLLTFLLILSIIYSSSAAICKADDFEENGECISEGDACHTMKHEMDVGEDEDDYNELLADWNAIAECLSEVANEDKYNTDIFADKCTDDKVKTDIGR